MADFIDEDFLLLSNPAKKLYYDYADSMPIYDYHCHLPADLIARDYCFTNLTRAWLDGDHYKWRAMRANGIAEKFIIGDADDYEKFEKWAQTVLFCLGNPLYHWSALELKKQFGISDKLLNPQTAKEIYHTCSDMLQSTGFSVRNILRKMNVKLLCTTEGPLDDLEYHKKILADNFEIKVLAAFRPDAAMAVENTQAICAFIDKLGSLCNTEIEDYHSYLGALRERHSYFHENGCRISDHSLDTIYAEDYTQSEVIKIFDKILAGKELQKAEAAKFKSDMLYELALMNYERRWIQQLHIGALRNNNSRLFKKLGPDIGCDSINDLPIAKPLSKFLDRLDRENELTKTIIYNLNPADNAIVATMAGNFQDGSVAGKIQHGPAWWFLDQKDGIQEQMRVLANMGLLSRFIGMTSDSRSFLSYSRHEYFRRILCNMLGSDIEAGLLPYDIKLIGEMVKNICYNNAADYFSIDI